MKFSGFILSVFMISALLQGCSGHVVLTDVLDTLDDQDVLDASEPADHGGADLPPDLEDRDVAADQGGGDDGFDDSTQPDTAGEIVDPDTASDSVDPDTASDTVDPDIARDTADPDTVGDTADPDTAGDTVDPDTDGDTLTDVGEQDVGQDVTADDGPDVPPGPCASGVPEYVGDLGWTGSLTVTEAATYCWPFDESLTLKESLARKSKIHFIPGTYPVPAAGEGLAMVLPFCMEFGSGIGGPTHLGQGTARAGEWGFQYTQPMEHDTAWEFQMSQWASTTSLDGSGGPGSIVACKSNCNEWLDRRRYDSCHYDNVDRQLHTVIFEGGQIVLELRIGMSMASTEPGIFFGASGTIDGKSFDVNDYWSLVYRPAHHHFSRNFAVMLDPEIFGACAIVVENAVAWPDQPDVELPTVSLADCRLDTTEILKVESHTLKRVSPGQGE